MENKSITRICAKSYPAALDALAQKLRGRRFDPEEYYVVLTPDRYTLHVETALFRGGGAIDCEVLTLSRLCRRVLPQEKILTKEGAVMLISRAVAQVSKQLKYYTHAAKYYDFSRNVYAAFQQVASSGSSLDDIPAVGITASKLYDLKLIKAEYDRLKAEYSDASDRLRSLIAAAKSSGFIKNTHFFAIGYSDPTRLNSDVFSAIAGASRSFTLYEVKGAVKLDRAVEVYRAPDPVTMYKKVASLIRALVRADADGVRQYSYGDISVIGDDPRTLCRILREYGISFYADRSVPLDKTPPVCALYALYRLRDGETEQLVSLCKNPFSAIDRDCAERLQKYFYERGIEYGAFDREIADTAVRAAVQRIDGIKNAFFASPSFADACDAAMTALDFDGTAARLFGDETDMIGPIRSALELTRRYGSGDFEQDATGFFSAVRAVNVNTLPRKSDRVTVCEPSALRLTACKMLFVVDFNEGVLPKITPEAGILTDVELASSGGRVEPTAKEVNRRNRNELYSVMANADSVYCAYSTAGGAKRSAFLTSIMSADMQENSFESDSVRLSVRPRGEEEKRELIDLISVFGCSEPAVRELSLRNMTGYSPALEAAANEYMCEQGMTDRSARAFVPVIDGIELSGISVSELTRWFECPYSRFLRYSLGLVERRKGTRGAPDFGILVHEFMQKFIDINYGNNARQTPDTSVELVTEIIDGILEERGEELGTDRASVAARARLIRNAHDYAVHNVKLIERGKYVPVCTEKPFGGKIKLGGANIPFGGVIDRIDVFGDHARIIDYKTYNKEFVLSQCLNGTDMQLPLYAAAVDLDVTGFFYSPLANEYDAADGAGRLSGAMIKDMDIAFEYDRRLSSERSDIINARLKSDGSDFYYPPSTMMEKEKFDAFIKYCVDTAARGVDEIMSGYIDRSPVSGVCERCRYGALCNVKRLRGGVSNE